MQDDSFSLLSGAIRSLSIDAVEQAKSGHPGMPLGIADVASVLFANHLRFDPKDVTWANRDRFVLSAGHGSMLLYSILHLLGVSAYSENEIKRFRQMGSTTPGHPEYGDCPGVEVTTGPLGQGIANAVGMAMAERHLSATLGEDVIDHHTYVLVGDGCLMEGISQEAISLAGHHSLEKLIVLYDSNNISIDGSTELSFSEDVCKRFEAVGFDTQTIDGHNYQAIDKALTTAKARPTPSLILCKTTIAFGSPNKSGTAAAHGVPLGNQEITLTKRALQLKNTPFFVADEARALWQKISERGSALNAVWQQKITAKTNKEQADISVALAKNLPPTLEKAIYKLKQNFVNDAPSIATRAASRKVLHELVAEVPSLVGGSADLSESNQTKPDNIPIYSKDNPTGRYIHYGVREHAMVAAMSGMALHGGIIPYGGTFLAFADYARPSLRLAALMKQRLIFVATHDSIGLGEDGPTHQPVEHLAALRAIPNLQVLRPCDAAEVAECWLIALQSRYTPSIIALSRQKTPPLRTTYHQQNICAKGGYVLSEQQVPNSKTTITIVASGTEVAQACSVANKLAEHQLTTRVVSMPCLDIFKQQELVYQQEVLGKYPIAVIEAGIAQSWEAIFTDRRLFFGVEQFGMSAPADEIFDRLGLTPPKITEKILHVLNA